MTDSSNPPVLSDKLDYGEKTCEPESASSEHDSEFERKTMRYVDWRIVPILGLLGSFALIDRINIGSAYTAGMGVDLGLLEGGRFSLALCVFFIPDILLQVPGNLLIRKFGVRNWITFTVVGWGAVQLGMGFVSSWVGLVVCRLLLGTFEATLYSSMAFIMTTWYKRHEVQTRFAVFMLIDQIAAGSSPILAYAFNLLNGRGNVAGWRWIFIMEGLITLVLGIITWFLIPDFPDQNTFLTAEQTALVLRRIDEDRGDAMPDVLTRQKVRQHLMDWKIWAFGILLLCCAMPAYSQAYFLPIILSQMGWSERRALLLTAAPYGTGIFALVVAFLADKYEHRCGFIVLTAITCMTGVALLAFSPTDSVRYFGAFLISGGTSGCVPAVLAYGSNNVVSHSKRSVQTAVQFMLGEIGGLLGTVVFRAQDAPRYTPGLISTLASQGVLLLVLLATTVYLAQQNRLMREGKRTKPLEGQPGFYYTL